MDFQSAQLCQVFRDEITSLGLQTASSGGLTAPLRDFPFHTVSSFDDLAKYLSRNQLLGDDSGSVVLGSFGGGGSSAPVPTTTDKAALALQQFFQLHVLTWPNAIVRVVIPKSKLPALAEVNKDLMAAKAAAGESGVASSTSVYRVGVVRSVHVSIPKAAASDKSAPTGPASSLQSFISDYLSKMLFFKIDFGDCVDEKFSAKFISNDAFTAEEFSILSGAIVSGLASANNNNPIFTNPTLALNYFFREPASTTQMRLYSCRLSSGTSSSSAATSALPTRKYHSSIARSFVSSEPSSSAKSSSLVGLQLTRAVQQLLCVEGAEIDLADDDAEGVGAAATPDHAALTYKELSAILHTIVAPQLEQLNRLLAEKEYQGAAGGGGIASSSTSGGGMAQLEESRKELYRIQLTLKEANNKNASLQADVERLTKEVQGEKDKVKKTLTTNGDLLNALKAARGKALENQKLLVDSRSMLKMNENAGPEEVLQALRRKLGQ